MGNDDEDVKPEEIEKDEKPKEKDLEDLIEETEKNAQKVPSSDNSAKNPSDEEKNDKSGDLVDLTVKKSNEDKSQSYIDKKLAESNKPTSYPPIMMKSVQDAAELERFGRDHLVHELKRRDCKSGGTCEQLAQRLFAIKGLTKKKIPKKYRAKEVKKVVEPKLLPEKLGRNSYGRFREGRLN